MQVNIFYCNFGILFSLCLFSLFQIGFAKVFIDTYALSNVRGSARIVYQENLFVITGNGISTVLWIWAINQPPDAAYLYTYVAFVRYRSVTNTDWSRRCFAFRLLKVATNVKLPYWTRSKMRNRLCVTIKGTPLIDRILRATILKTLLWINRN